MLCISCIIKIRMIIIAMNVPAIGIVVTAGVVMLGDATRSE